MKKYFAVSFKYSESVYYSNIAHAETAEAVNAHYSKYEWVSVRECEDYEVETARRKGMPIVEIETPEAITEEPEQKEEETEMKDYNYLEAMKEDVLQYIRDEIDLAEFDSLEELEEKLNDDLWTVDSVTGNGSGSYTFNRYQAEEYICHNLDLLAEALEEFGGGADVLKDGAEAADVTIRCYLLGQAIAEALEEIENDFEEAHPDEESEEE